MGLTTFTIILMICCVFSNELEIKVERTKRMTKGEPFDSGAYNSGAYDSGAYNSGAYDSGTYDSNIHGGPNNNGDLSNNFRGTAGVDYPDFKSIPTTNFRCDEQQYDGGLYADVEAQCQVYHVCHEGRKDSFICGRGTIFNQEILACDYWYSTDCNKAPSFYYVNSQIGVRGDSGSAVESPSGNTAPSGPSNQGPTNQAGLPRGPMTNSHQNPSTNNRAPNFRPNSPANVPRGTSNQGQNPSNNIGGSNYGPNIPAAFPRGDSSNPGQAPSNIGAPNYRQNNQAGFPRGDNSNNVQSPVTNLGTPGRRQNVPAGVPGRGNFNNQQQIPTGNIGGPVGIPRGDSSNTPRSAGRVGGSGQQNPDKDDCCCQKYSIKQPWAFPSSQKQISKK